MLTHPQRTHPARRVGSMLVAITASLAAVSACSPGSHSKTADAAPSGVSVTVGTSPTTLTILVSTPDVALFNAFGTAFHAKYPNVTVKVNSQDYNSLVTNTPRILAGSDVPDLVRSPRSATWSRTTW